MNSTRASIYKTRWFYHLAMRLLYGRDFPLRYKAIADLIPEKAQVIDICSGDCYLYLKFLKSKSVEYLGLDISPPLVKWAQHHGIDARIFDMWQDELPSGQIVVMQASLYQFIPEEQLILNKLVQATQEKLILTEPVRNLSTSTNPLIAALSRKLTEPLVQTHAYSGQRLSIERLESLIHSTPDFSFAEPIAGGKEWLTVFKNPSHELPNSVQ